MGAPLQKAKGDVKLQADDFCKVSCFLFPKNMFPRKQIMPIVAHRYFDNFIILLIGLNCICLAIDDPLDLSGDSANPSPLKAFLNMAEYVFLFFFTLESVLKIIAMGFILDKNSYLRNPWNWLDFVVVVIGYLSIFNIGGNLSGLRTFRVLRPLKTMTTVPGMKVIVSSMLASIPALSGVLLLAGFFFVVFGIIGVQLWGGVLKSRCFYNTTSANGSMIYLVSEDEHCAFQCPGGKTTGLCTVAPGGASCGTRWNGTEFQVGSCREYENPAFGAGNFDNFGDAIMYVFTSVTLEGWVDVMYALYASYGMEPLVSIYFLLLVVFGSFFVLNLAMAVIMEEYDNASAEKAAQDEQDEKDQAAKDEKEKLERENSGVAVDVKESEADDEPKQKTYWLDAAPVRVMHRLVNWPWFGHFITLMIILNTLTLGIEFYHMPQILKDILKVFNYIFFTVFLLEMIFKLIGLGVREYVSDSFNCFDGIIVTISVVEFGMEMAALAQGGTTKKSGLSALRSFRLLRVFKLARSWKDLQKLLVTIMKSVLLTTNAAILLLVIMFIFTLLGMQLFGGKMKYEYYGETEEDKPKAHFDYFWWAFMTVFQVLTGENWNDVLFNTEHALKQPDENSTHVIAIIYFVLLNCVGNFMILNLFLAILLSLFENPEEEEEDGEKMQDGKYKIDSAKVAPLPGSNGADAGGGIGADTPIVTPVEPREGSTNYYHPRESSFFIFSPSNPIRVACFRLVDHPTFDNIILVLIGISTILLCMDEPHLEYCKTEAQALKFGVESCAGLVNFMVIADWVISVLFLFEMLFKMIALGLFMHRGAYLRDGWNWLDFLIVIISFLSLGMADRPELKALRSLRALRALKPLRVVKRYPGLRLVVNAIFKAIPPIGNVFMVAILFFAIFGILGVQLWMGAMRHCNDPSIETMKECKGNFTLEWEDCTKQPFQRHIELCQKDALILDPHPAFFKEIGLTGNVSARYFPRQWENVNPWHFDNIGNAMLTLFEVCSGEMWPDIMYDTVNAKGYDEPMYKYENNWPANTNGNDLLSGFYFICVTIVITFLMVNIFIGVVIDTYNEIKDEETGKALVTESQQQWLDMMRLLLTKRPELMMEEPKVMSSIRKPFFVLVESKQFEFFIMAMILLNTLCLAVKTHPQSAETDALLKGINTTFAIIFTVEMLLKWIGLGLYQYQKLMWNRFDGFLVLTSWIGMAFDLGQYATLLRIARVARIFRLVKTSKSLLELFKTLVFAFPAIQNVGTVTVLALLIFSVLGMNLFSGVKEGDLLTSDANFNTFGVAFMTLFRASTGESFNGIMHDLMVMPPYCLQEELPADHPELEGCGVDCIPNCGSGIWLSPIFFVLFFVMLNFILMNIIVAVVLDTFSEVVALNDNDVTESHMESFQEAWAFFDHNANKWIDVRNLPQLICMIEHPLGLANNPDIVDESELKKVAIQWENALNIKVAKHDITMADSKDDLDEEGFVYEISFQETLQALALRAGSESGFKMEEVAGKVKAEMESMMDRKNRGQQNKAMRRKTVETLDLKVIAEKQSHGNEGSAVAQSESGTAVAIASENEEKKK